MRIIKLSLAILMAIATGAWGFGALFADSPPNWPLWLDLSYIATVHGVICVAIGWLTGRHWYTAVIAAWGALCLGAIGLITRLNQGAGLTAWTMTLFMILGVPAVCLLGGSAGHRLAQRLLRSDAG